MKTIIVGGGLTGLVTAYSLKKAGIEDFLILEAQDRLGGRVKTIFHEGHLPVEMGPTWVHHNHYELLNLLKELDIPAFPQFDQGTARYQMMGQVQSFVPPAGQAPSYRIGGGSEIVTQKLSESLTSKQYRLSTQVTSIREEDDHHLLLMDNKGNEYRANTVIFTIPPKFALQTVAFTPALPEDLQYLMKSTYTWMSSYIKSAVVYKTPFWKEKGFSGMAFSQEGPMAELYDHTDIQEEGYALQGFVSMIPKYMQMTKEEREQAVIQQLVQFFGKEAEDYLSYYEKDWSKDPHSAVPNDTLAPSKHLYGHLLYQKNYLNGKLRFSCTETSPENGGFMEGAVLAGKEAANFVQNV
ncbi:flavin monoamine oxidase family protein [Algivirga pacifica]|uniref:FAD-dependent oxidoreductase n=1 Tax=Algivirga pacifica TaxID=1162670 RepID=A0ABP9D0Q2_9BACT